MSAQRDYWSKILAKHAGRHTTIRERERRTYKIIAMPQSRILVGQAVRSRRNIVLVVFASCITGNSDRLVYLKYIGQVMLDGFKGDKYLGHGGCLASLQTVGVRLETSRVMTLRWLSGSGKEPSSRVFVERLE